jgi:hypothetical protein
MQNHIEAMVIDIPWVPWVLPASVKYVAVPMRGCTTKSHSSSKSSSFGEAEPRGEKTGGFLSHGTSLTMVI